ncbi:RNA polymerase, sigma-24 subunit, ECF subfamily [Fibrella aestuarina BUZ 2]|uniref:RNA polymerase, sigma-24 subunit, ECF subfamily n=1 Tax=Fibrella aestuarina BUZ 2 TaxID=1166018 RepID=I0K8E2_9BACT|nr:sigma-70 family RNA polymerase sigma factor [Fibrella aestuarina]CCH00395.1 RNA polymerase, sigma-24 subunit, ECF subfamily [Fibrella aestuarina BUZ 2]
MKAHLTQSEHIALWNTFRSGQPDAFSTLYSLFSADLYRYGYNLVRNRQVVEDCLHELFLHLHENRSRLGPTDNIRFYLYRSLRRRLLDTVGRLARHGSDEYLFTDAAFTIQPHEHVLIESELAERQKALVTLALNQLPRRQKEILYLVYMKGLTYPQAAEVMAISLKSVYNTINIALMAMRRYVRQSVETSGALLSLIGWLVAIS